MPEATIPKNTSAVPPSTLNPCLKSDIQFKNLPAEIVLRILSYLSPHDLVQSAACCREWYFMASDPILWRDLELSLLCSKIFNPKTATSLVSRLRSCRSFTLREPKHLSQQHISALLHFLAGAPRLQSLRLEKLNHLLNSHSLEQHFRFSQSRCLTHVDFNHSNVTTAAVVAMMEKHKGTLQTLDLSYTGIGDGTLRAVSQAKVLNHLNISSCPSISRTSIRNFLTKRFPACITTLSLRNLREVKISWLYELLKLPTAANLKVLNVEGCERLTLGDLQGLQEFCSRVQIKHDAREAEDTVWGYRRYIEYLGDDPTMPERLAGAPKKPEEPVDEATSKHLAKDLIAKGTDKSKGREIMRDDRSKAPALIETSSRAAVAAQ